MLWSAAASEWRWAYSSIFSAAIRAALWVAELLLEGYDVDQGMSAGLKGDWRQDPHVLLDGRSISVPLIIVRFLQPSILLVQWSHTNDLSERGVCELVLMK